MDQQRGGTTSTGTTALRSRSGDRSTVSAAAVAEVHIRILLSFSLEIEIEGVLPWRRALVSGGRGIVDATLDARGSSQGPAAGDGVGLCTGSVTRSG